MRPTVIVPGYLAAATDYAPLAQSLRTRLQAPVVVVPLTRQDWFVTLGGRPVTPILTQLEATINMILAESGATQVNLIGHSAGGWIGRIFMGEQPYCDRVWAGHPLVHTLITLGTPHQSQERWTRSNLDFVNQNYPGAFQQTVRYVCVAGKSRQGKRSWRFSEWFTYQSYALTIGVGDCWGDGVTPVDAAHLEGATNLTFDGVWHSPPERRGADLHKPWYGTEQVLAQWQHYLI